MGYKPSDVEKILIKKLGMSLKSRPNNPHSWYVLEIEGLNPITTMLPTNHKKDIEDSLLSIISRQLQVKPIFFKGILDCHISRDDYLKLLREYKGKR